jgi:hypothetical protein
MINEPISLILNPNNITTRIIYKLMLRTIFPRGLRNPIFEKNRISKRRNEV